MKDNQQIGQAIYKMSEGKRKQLFNHLLNEFRNSKVNIGTPNYLSGAPQGMPQPSSNLSGNTPSTIKHNKKKSSSIEKKLTTNTIQGGTDLIKKQQIPKKTVNHKKSKSYITANVQDQLRDQSINHSNHQQQLYYQQMMRKDMQVNGSTLENSFGQGAISNKSYERILAETIEAQNTAANQFGGGAINYISNQYYQVSPPQNLIPNVQTQHNMTLQLSSKRGNGNSIYWNPNFDRQCKHLLDTHQLGEVRLSNEPRKVLIRLSEQQIQPQLSQVPLKQQTYIDLLTHLKLFQIDSKYDQQQKKKSRGSDQFQINSNQRSKCESNRNSKKNSPNNTINTSKGTINIREARTKPTSPERSYVLINSFKQGGTKGSQGSSFVIPGSMVNQREERKALNMMSNINQNQHQQQNSSSLSQNNRMSQNQIMNHQQQRINGQEFVSIQQQASSKRKNFKNMFYSPKGGRDAFTEPHSKYPSQAHTKEHSPAHKMLEISQQFSQTSNPQQLLPSAINHSTTLGHHPKIRASANKPPTQLKNKSSNLSTGVGLMYSTKDSNNKKQKLMAHSQIQELEGAFQTSSFLEESYMKNATNNYQIRRDDISFDSSNNQFSQTGTPNQYKMKLNIQQPSNQSVSGHGAVKKINVVGRDVLQSQLQNTQQQIPNPIMQSNSTIERKPKKIVMQGGNQYPHTTGLNTKTNSQIPSPTNSKLQRPQNQQKKQRFQSEASSPLNHNPPISTNGIQLQELPAHKKRGISISGHPSGGNNFQISNQQDSIESFNNTKKFSQNPAKMTSQNQQQFLFNQYVKTKKQRQKIESNEGSLERGLQHGQTVGAGVHLQPLNQEPFFDQQHLKHSATELSPRSKEVNLIKSLIKECFAKYSKPPKTQIELYKIGKMLGKGAFGRVNLGLHRLTRRLVAIKTINMEFMKDESSKKKMSNEISILKMLRHPNVVKLLETFDTEKHHLIVMELCPGGDLLNYVRKRRKLNENMAKFVFKQIMEGIAYLHQNGVVHRDIKLDNILLDGHGHIKLADFGVSRKVSENNELLFEQCGTPAYIAPEIVRELGYKGYPVDIWSAGVCLYAMLYGNVPFKANQMGDLNKMILDANIEYKDTASEEARDLMMRMLQKNPNKRLTAEEVLDHAWFDQVDEQINIFDEQELDLIKKEFTYVCQKAKLKELKQRKPDDLNTEFTEHSINSNENTLMKNNSSRSVILCPFNTQAGAAAKSIYEDIRDMLVDKDMAIRFNARVRECDRQYEKFNNQDFDNGVYHKYAYNQGKNKEEVEALKEEVIDKDDVKNKNLVRRGNRRLKPDADNQNYYIKIDEKITVQVEEFGFPKPYILKCLNDNVNNHCTTSYYLLCMDQNY
ncbi:protein kinase domain containing protein [Stylonychia lemnae]|uniref:Protein kinase domain containing protein n=1 Tax=Stylonychia lemnae TaxID=5949 RepID=A0A078A9C6_STYLE|nr:protein kinase domain containing protein [Stylonychia lemnae]|eukprot:CDW78202.1 protein kinase domain containing protein [Stylonychia lemnae]